MRLQGFLKFLVSIFEFAFLLRVDSGPCRERRRKQQHQESDGSTRSLCWAACDDTRNIAGGRRNVNSRTHSFPLGNQDRQGECNQAATEWPLVTFNWTARQTHVHFSSL